MLDGMQACVMALTYLRSLVGLLPMCRATAAMSRASGRAAGPRAMTLKNEPVAESLTASCYSHPTYNECGELAGIVSKAGKRCGGMRRGICGTHLRGFSEGLQPSISRASDCSVQGAEEGPGETAASMLVSGHCCALEHQRALFGRSEKSPK